ncbi:MAG: hypothetical protein ACRDRO_18550 [Pseudonocardiaceae bacterium]
MPSISTYAVVGAVSFQPATPAGTTMELYRVFGVVQRVYASESGRGGTLALRGTFGAVRPKKPTQELRSEKAYLPGELAQPIALQLQQLREDDPRAQLQFWCQVRVYRDLRSPSGYTYNCEERLIERCDPFRMLETSMLEEILS